MPRSHRILMLAAAAALAATAGLTGPAAQADTSRAAAGSSTTPVSAVPVSPNPVAVGSTATVSVSATNTGRSALGQVALGVTTTLAGAGLTPPVNGRCRVTNVVGKRLYYCLLSSLGAGQTATFTFTVTPSAAGSYVFDAYARNISTMLQTTSSTTLAAN
jgi:hypothetical protein